MNKKSAFIVTSVLFRNMGSFKVFNGTNVLIVGSNFYQETGSIIMFFGKNMLKENRLISNLL